MSVPAGRGRLLGSAHGPGRGAGCGRDRGSATVLVLAVVAVALVLAVAAVALGRAAGARGMAQSAADLAAIAAAEAVQQRGPDPCRVAAQVSTANGATLQSCDVLAGGDVTVGTAVEVQPLVGWRTVASAEARAGPVR